jgi:uncharacterized protein (DUF2141 family)
MSLNRASFAFAAGIIMGLSATASVAACEGTPTAARLEVSIEGVRSSAGQMAGSIYPGDPSQFLIKDGALKVWRVPAEAGVTKMCVWLKNGPGVYAFAVYHDANDNGRWDHNLFRGIEGFGFSNNPHTFFSAPSFDQVKFTAGPGVTTLHVRLRYP